MNEESNHKKLERDAWHKPLDIKRKEKIVFEVGKPVEILIPGDFIEPIQKGNDSDGYFYIFDVIHEGQDKVIITSAETLLKGFKLNRPLRNKKFIVEKKTMTINGKTRYFYNVQEKKETKNGK